MARKRYDTEQLVNEIKADRRNTILLALASVAIIVALIALYVTGVDSEDVPDVPAPSQAQPAEAPKPAPAPVAEPAKEEPPKAPAKVSIALSRKGRLWIDGSAVGKAAVTKHSAELEPGSHTIKAKIGRAIVTSAVDIEAGAAYELRVDHKRKKIAVKKLN